MKRFILILSAFCIAAPALAKAPTPPSRAAAMGVLYAQLSPQRWRIGFADTGTLNAQSVERRILKEAAKLTLHEGFTWFAPIGENPEPVETKTAIEVTRPPDSNEPPSLYLTWGSTCGGAWAFAPTPDGLCKASPTGQADRWQATTQIMMGHGIVPANGRAYDARQVLKTP